MRPRLYRRGNLGTLRFSVSSPEPFNEATAVSPWKLCYFLSDPEPVFPLSMKPQRFRRGNQPRVSLPCYASEISMKPRRFRRGNAPRAVLVDTPEEDFQCGHDCIAVETRRPVAAPARPASFQCGHGCIAVETIRVCGHPAIHRLLSMRPRLYHRGNCATAGGASRRQRSFNEATAV